MRDVERPSSGNTRAMAERPSLRPELQVRRTRGTPLFPFGEPVGTERYEHIAVERAKVGQSTSSAHGAGEDVLLSASIAGPFSERAGTSVAPATSLRRVSRAALDAMVDRVAS